VANIALIGCGYWGKNLARNFYELDALSHVVDDDEETIKKISVSYKARIATWHEVLANPSIDAVALATPAKTHAALSIEALNAGKHVYVEKPLALTTDEANAVEEASKLNNKIVMVGHLLQYHPIYQRLREEIKIGRIGVLQYCYSNRLSLGKFRIEENVMWSFAPHDISMILALVDSKVESVSAQGASYVTQGIVDFATIQIAFANGTKAHVFTSWLHPFKEHRLVAVGTKGMMVFEDSQPEWGKKLAYYSHTFQKTGGAPVPIKGDVEYLICDQGEPLAAECRHFIDCIEENERPITDSREALAVLNVLEQAEHQMRV
jgi:predicted dehydrogenase